MKCPLAVKVKKWREVSKQPWSPVYGFNVIIICKPNKDKHWHCRQPPNHYQTAKKLKPTLLNLTFTTTLEAFSTHFPLQLHGTLTFYLCPSRFLLRSPSIRKWPFYKLIFKLLWWLVYLQKLTELRARKGRALRCSYSIKQLFFGHLLCVLPWLLLWTQFPMEIRISFYLTKTLQHSKKKMIDTWLTTIHAIKR